MLDGVKELLALLRAFVHEVPLTDAQMEDVNQNLLKVLELANLHKVRGIWAYQTQEYAKQNPEVLDAEVVDAAERIFTVAKQKAVYREQKYQGLKQQFQKAKIDFLPFKGILVKELYPVPELRTFGDIDVVIRVKDRERSHALMKELQYSATVDFEPVFIYEQEREVYEIHTSIMAVNMTNRADYIGYFQNLWQYATEKEDHVWEFTPEFHFVYLLSHIAKHIYGSGAGIRMYLDLAFYIRRLGATMDWAWIQAELKKLELNQFFYLTMDCIRRWFCVELPIEVPKTEDDLFELFTEFTMESDVFGYTGRSHGEQEVRKAENVRHRALQKTLFPSARVLKARYTYLQKCPYLLPIAWVDRLFRNIGSIGCKLEESMDILTTKEESIREKKQFYDEIGL